MAQKRLSQVLAIEAQARAEAHKEVTRIHQALQKASLVNGFSKTYHPFKEDVASQKPPEIMRVQVNTREAIAEMQNVLVELFDVTATKDYGNTSTSGDVVVDGKTLLAGAPVSYLLFVLKQLTDIHTFIEKLPKLDPAESWKYSKEQGYYVTEPVKTVSTQKVLKVLEKAPPTDKFAGQYETYPADDPVGTWDTVKFSSALRAPDVKKMLARVEKLQKAVKEAIEEANALKVDEQHVGETIMSYIIGDISEE